MEISGNKRDTDDKQTNCDTDKRRDYPYVFSITHTQNLQSSANDFDNSAEQTLETNSNEFCKCNAHKPTENCKSAADQSAAKR